MAFSFLRSCIRMLFILDLTGYGDAYDLTECNSGGNFDIVQNQQPVLTCTGLGKMQRIYWSIRNSSSGEEMRIGNCSDCKGQGCSGCSPPVDGYNISRDVSDSTTLQFLNHSLVIDGSIIKCSNLRNKFNATCTLFVVPAYRFSECRAGAIMVAENKKSPVVCEGLLAEQNMYWTVTYGNGTGSTIAQCTYCQNKPKTCPKCKITDADFNVTREDNSSTLVIQNNVRQKDGATLTCSKKDNATHSDCKILVLYVEEANITLHDNWTVTGTVTVSKVPASHNITCLWYNSVNNEMYRLASSAAVLTPYNESDTGNEYINVLCRLNTTLRPYMVGRNGIFVKILPDGRPFLATTVTVARDVHVNQEPDTAFPVAAVAGSAVGVVFIVAAVIVIAVIVKRRRQQAQVLNREDATCSTNGAADNYDGLHIPDVGQRSVYSEIGPRPVSSSSGADYIDLYHGLDMSEVGQRSEYSQLGQNI